MNKDAIDDRMFPGVNCFVAHRDEHRGKLGVVVDIRSNDSGKCVGVRWGGSGIVEWHSVSELRSGFRSAHVVQDRPKSNIRKSLGVATVVASRRIADREMVLVQLHSTGESRWLPYENLVRLKDASFKYDRAEAAEPDSAERFRLRVLAYALDSWNQITGALDRLDVDPLPHQIDLVHRIMTSDQAHWLIADDVGLGKTIEVGLLLAAMKRRRQARRVLIVCPAGIVRQWQDEMRYKFNEDFQIYGTDFSVPYSSHWTRFDKVIVSIDRAKSDRHSPIFNDSGDWDVIVVDEAHHLSRNDRHTTLRYRLAQDLQRRTDRLIFLSGTPHQGDVFRFVNLLRLLRPDLERRLSNVFMNPAVVAEVVLRNRKSAATDMNGRLIFKGQDTHLVSAPPSAASKEFDQQLQRYLRKGYSASEAGGNTGRAIGFVMTTYRKLASSSIAAIEKALLRRMARLEGESDSQLQQFARSVAQEIEEALRDGVEGHDDLDSLADRLAQSFSGVSPFFDDERSQILSLLTAARDVKSDDWKIKQFLSEIVAPLYEQGEQLLIFTEYRGTQDYLVEALENHYPGVGVASIHGSMSLNEKRENVSKFNTQARFLVSTEAGGEGINLHERCHILVNYDLPWNPSRLVQRAGRLYRYGQRKRVIVFNITADDNFDNRALSMMLERVSNIARDMAGVGPEYQEGLEIEILGELLERIDVTSILADNSSFAADRTEDEIENAIERAKVAKTQQEKLFSYVGGYDQNISSVMHTFGVTEVLAFLESILPYEGVEIRRRLNNGRTLELELPEKMRGKYSEFPERATIVRVTVDRALAMKNPRLVPMDFASSFFSDLIKFAESPAFKGEYACLPGPEAGALAIYKVRWQNDQGIPQWEALLPVFLPEGGQGAIGTPEFFGTLLVSPTKNLSQLPAGDETTRKDRLDHLRRRAEVELASRCSPLRHPNDIVILAAADLVPDPEL